MTQGALTGQHLRAMLQGAALHLEKNKEQVNALNVFPVPDGDTGTNMYLTLAAAVKEALKGPDDLPSVAAAASTGSLMGARGNSGIILSQLFRGAAQVLANCQAAGPRDVAQALVEATRTAYRAVMKPVEGTILTVARLAARNALTAARNGGDVQEVLRAALTGAREALAKTPSLLPVLREAGVVDAGGQGLVVILEGALAALTGQEVSSEAEILPVISEPVERPHPAEERAAEDITFGYCTEVLLRGRGLKADALREKLHRYGDSLLVVGDEETVKVHIHTNHPGQVLEELLGYGTLHDIKIDNMRDQHREYVKSEARETKEEKRLSVVAVAQGEGLMAAFKSLGADVVLSGGQTMNPSTEEFVKAVEGAPAMEVLVLPNNKNVILAARQAEGLTSKRIAVVPTRSIPQGIAALVAFNPELGLEENAAFMAEAAKRVKTGEVTYAVRSSRLNGHEINAGDILGLIDGELVVTGGEVEEVAEQILTSMVNGGSELITIFAGQDVTPEAAEALRRRIQERFAECEVELHVGGQPLYYYILSVE